MCQLFTILQWGRLSGAKIPIFQATLLYSDRGADRIGRKPVILLGLSGVALSTLLFGLSRTFWWAVISRSMAGALSGNAAVVQSVVGEITDETNQALAFPLTGLSWSFGCIIGPMIGYVRLTWIFPLLHQPLYFYSFFHKISSRPSLTNQLTFVLLSCVVATSLTRRSTSLRHSGASKSSEITHICFPASSPLS